MSILYGLNSYFWPSVITAEDAHGTDDRKPNLRKKTIHNREHFHLHGLSILLYRSEVYDHSHGIYIDSRKQRQLDIPAIRVNSGGMDAENAEMLLKDARVLQLFLGEEILITGKLLFYLYGNHFVYCSSFRLSGYMQGKEWARDIT